MFEQTFVHTGGAVRRPWSMAASLAAQVALTGFVLCLPLMKTAEIMWRPPHVVYILPHIEQKAPVVAISNKPASTSNMKPVFDARLRAPTRIPDKVARIVDEMPVPDMSAGLFSGSAGGQVQFLDQAAGGVVLPAPPAPPPDAKLPRQAAVRVGGDVQQAMLLRQVIPAYPQLARSARISGKVLLAAVIAPDGTVQRLQLISGPPLLVDAALKAVRQWTYRPTRLNGEPVEVITEITVNFTLSQ